MYCCSNMYRSCAFIKRLSFYRVLFQIACFFIPIYSLAADNYSRIIGKRVVMPSSYVDTADYIFIHIVRGQECTECSINALYQWDYIIAMIGRSDTSYYFIVEPRPEDTPESLQASLLDKPFLRPYFVDYTHEFIRDNPWLSRRKNL